MKFSVITPTFNSSASIAATVDSVLMQDFDDFEHLIIDNVSSDTTLQIVRDRYKSAGKLDKLHVFSEPDKGISDAFNKGIARASGEFILILNSDDALFNSTVFSEATRFLQHGGYLIMHGDMMFVDDTFGSNRRAPLFCPVEAAMPYNHPGMFIHRDLYKQFGVYSLQFHVAMDYEIILRLDTLVEDFQKKIGYFNKFPLTITKAGGASWIQEQKGINEVRTALQQHGRYNSTARYHYWIRSIRTKTKAVLLALKLQKLIKIWRNRKWRY